MVYLEFIDKRTLSIPHVSSLFPNYYFSLFEYPFWFSSKLLDVPLLQRSLELWKELDSYHRIKYSDAIHRPLELCGGLMIGKPNSEVIQGTLQSIQQHSLPHKILSSQEIRQKYHVFNTNDDEIGIWEANAGYLHPEVCIETYIEIAQINGVIIHYGEGLKSYATIGSGPQKGSVEVITDKGRYIGKKLILTVGAWALDLYASQLPFPLYIVRRVLFWFEQTDPSDKTVQKHFQVQYITE
jgi:sarcosine oxidase